MANDGLAVYDEIGLSLKKPPAKPTTARDVTRSSSPAGTGIIYSNNSVVHPPTRTGIRRTPSQSKTIKVPPQTCSRFGCTSNQPLDAKLRQFEKMISKDGQNNRNLLYVGNHFAGGMFDIDGGYLNIPDLKLTMYIPPRSIPAESEPLYISGDVQMNNAPSLQDGEQLVSPIITCGKPETETKMGHDIVISFPLYSHFRDENNSLQAMRKEIGRDKQWQILADEIDCLKVVNRNGRCTLMVDKLGCYAIVANCPASEDLSQTANSTTVCVGVFAKTYKTQDTVNLVVCFWRDSVATKQRVLGEELKGGLVLLDQTRTLLIEAGDKKVFVELKGIKPGWVARDKDHKRTFHVDTLLRNLDSCSVPSCTFGLDYIATQKSSKPTAQCAIEVYTDSRTSGAEPVKFEAVIHTDSGPKGATQKSTVESHLSKFQPSMKQRQCELRSTARPPNCLTYKPLREIAQYLNCPSPKGRHASGEKVWVTFAKEMGLTRTNIMEVQERYEALTPGVALLDLYFGENLTDTRPPRDIAAKLLGIFKRMHHDEIANKIRGEIRQFKHRIESGNVHDKPSENYELIQSPLLSAAGQRSSSPQLPPRDRPSLPGIPDNNSRKSQSPKPAHRSPKPPPRSRPSDAQNVLKSGSLPDYPGQDIDDGSNLYDRPTGPQRGPPQKRTSFLYGADGSPAKYGSGNSSAKMKDILGVGTPSRDSKFSRANRSFAYPYPSVPDRNRSHSLPTDAGDADSNSEEYFNSDPESARGSSDIESAKCEVDQHRRRKGERVLGQELEAADNVVSYQAVCERKRVFEGADSALQDMQTKLSNMSGNVSRVAQTGGAKMKEAASSVIAQLKTRFSVKTQSAHRREISTPKLLDPEESPFKGPQMDKMPIYDSVPIEPIGEQLISEEKAPRYVDSRKDSVTGNIHEKASSPPKISERPLPEIVEKSPQEQIATHSSDVKEELYEEANLRAKPIVNSPTASLPGSTKPLPSPPRSTKPSVSDIDYEPEPQYDTPVSWVRPGNTTKGQRLC